MPSPPRIEIQSNRKNVAIEATRIVKATSVRKLNWNDDRPIVIAHLFS